MCELLGLAFNEPVTADVSFRGFRHRGACNPDGWGLAWFEGGQAQLRKEAKGADECQAADEIQEKMEPGRRIKSSVFIGHVRLASRGELAKRNTHPFEQRYRGQPVVFAHNGTLHDLPDLPASAPFRPCGQTDSEHGFCLISSWMEERGTEFSEYAQIENLLRRLNRHGKTNVLFSDGTALFAYRDMRGCGSLHATQRRAPFRKIRLRDKDWRVDLVDLAERKSSVEQGYIFATEPLTDGEEWFPLEEGKLLVIRDGSKVYPSQTI